MAVLAPAAVALAVALQIALGLLHVALGVAEALLAFQPKAFEPPLQLGQPIAQLALALFERRPRLVRLGRGVVARRHAAQRSR